MGHDPYTGKPIRSRVYGDTEAEYNQNLKIAHMNAKDKTSYARVKFRDYAERWFALYKSGLQPGSLSTLRTSLNRMSDLFDKPVCKITTADIQEIINENISHPRSCQRIRNLASQIFDRAVYEGFASVNPCMFLELPKYVAPEKRVLTEEEKELLPEVFAALAPMDSLFLQCEWHFGLRPQECRGLKKQDFDFRKKQVTIRRAAAFLRRESDEGGIKPTKNYKIRSIPIPDSFVPVLKEYFHSLKVDYLFTSPDGALLTEWHFRKLRDRIFSTFNEMLGGDAEHDMLDGMTFYTFRHTFCTYLYNHTTTAGGGGITLKMAAYLCGHTVDVFLRIYSHLDTEAERKNAASILSER